MKGLSRGEIRGVITLLTVVSIMICMRIAYGYIKDEVQSTEVINRLNKEFPQDSTTLFEFDPNTANLRTLRALGLSKDQAVSIIRFREAGKVYHIKEDLYTCYSMDDSTYYALEPYIVIAEEYRYKKFTSYDKPSSKRTERETRKLTQASLFRIDTVSKKYLYAIGAMSLRQGEVFEKWRKMIGGIKSIDDFAECYSVSDSVASALEKYIIFPDEEAKKADQKVDINQSDTAELCKVYGIGQKSAAAIVEYRKKLGGFYSVEQLSEVKEVTESNYEKILQQISCDSCDISKIDVNFAAAKQLNGHPYISKDVLRRLLKVRQLKGGWSTIEEMKLDNILSEEEATRLRPYLLFAVQTS